MTLSINQSGKEVVQLVHGRPWLLDKITEKDANGIWNVKPAEAESINIEIISTTSGDL